MMRWKRIWDILGRSKLPHFQKVGGCYPPPPIHPRGSATEHEVSRWQQATKLYRMQWLKRKEKLHKWKKEVVVRTMRWNRRWELGDQDTEDGPTYTLQFLRYVWTNLNCHIFKKEGVFTPIHPLWLCHCCTLQKLCPWGFTTLGRNY